MPSIPVVIVAGLHAETRGELVRRLLAANPHSVAVHHDLRDLTRGMVRRVVLDAWGVREHTDVMGEHPCVSCTIREDMLPAVERLADDARLIVLELWGSVEPRFVTEQVARLPRVHLAGVLTAVDAALLPDDLTSGDRLGDRSLTAADGDERFVAEVLVRQLEYASKLVLRPAGEGDDTALAAAMLEHLGAGTPVAPIDAVDLLRATASADPAALAARVEPPTLRLPCDARSAGVSTVLWKRLRPFHPGRLYAALEDIAGAAVRSRGRCWVANRPDTMLFWDCVSGILGIEDYGPWLAALPPAAWDGVPPERVAAAALDWYPKLGDRVQLLSFTGPELDREELFALLDPCLLTDEEMLAGSHAWESYADPFAGVLD